MDRGMDKEYAGIAGVPAFNKVAAQLAFGDNCAPLKEGRVSDALRMRANKITTGRVRSCAVAARSELFPVLQVVTTQSISGTGALRIGGAFFVS